MTLTQTLPILAAIPIGIIIISIAAKTDLLKTRNIWIVPAVLCALFTAWSAFAVVQGKPLGFWAEHTRNIWGNQIWFDLLLSITAALCLLMPRAKALGMQVLPWIVLISFTGSIGLSAMIARLLYLENRVITL